MAQLADWEKRQTNVRPYVRAHGMQRLPCSHVLWRRHGGARTRYTISSEMGQRCDAWQVSASCSPNTRKSGRAEALERKFTAVTSPARQLIGREGAQRPLIGLLRTKTSLQVPPPSWHVTWRSKAHCTTLRPPSSPEPSVMGQPIGCGRKHRRLDWITVQELTSAATLRQNSELQLISVPKR